jgi:translocation and assembly module TamB
VLRVLSKAILAMLGFLFVAVAVLRGALELSHTRSWIADTLEATLSRDDIRVEIEDLGGSLPFAPTAARVSIADAVGVWLTIEGLRVDVTPLELLSREVHARTLTADRVTMSRRPVPDDKPFELRPLRLGVRVDALDVRELRFGREVLGADQGAGEIGPISAHASGTVDLRRLTLDVVVSGSTPRVGERLYSDDVAAGAAELELHARGAIEAPSGELELGVSDLSIADIVVARIDLRAKAERLGMGERRYRVELSGTTLDLRGLPEPAQSLVGGEPVLNGAVRFGESMRVFDVDALSLAAATFAAELTARGSASGDVEVPRFTATWPDLGAIAGAAPWLERGTLRLRGAGRIEGAFNVTPDRTPRLRADVALKGEDLVFDDARLQALAGSQPLLSATIASPPGSAGASDRVAWTADAIALVAAKLRAGGKAAFDTTKKRGSAELEIALPELAALSGGEQGFALSGALRSKVVAEGTADAFDVTAELKPEGLRVGKSGEIAGNVALVGSGSPAATQARLEGRLTLGGAPLVARGRGEYLNERRSLRVESLELSGLAAKADAKGEIFVDSKLASGTVTLGSSDLSKLAHAVGFQATGTLEGRVDLTQDRGVQRVRFVANGAGLRIEGDGLGLFVAESASAKGELRDPFGRLDIELDSSAGDVSWRDAEMDRVRLDIKRSDGKARFDVEAAGRYRGSFDLHAEGRHSGSRQAATVVIEEIVGTLRGHSLRNTRPVELALRDGNLAVRDLALAIDGGALEGTWGQGGLRAVGRVRAVDLPLDLVGLATERISFGGRLTAEIERSARGEDLVARLRTQDAAIVASDGQAAAQEFSLDLNARAGTWRSLLDAKIVASTDGSTLDLSADLPFGLVGGTTGSALRGRVAGTLMANIIDDLLLPDDERLRGKLDLDLALGGTLRSPRLDGYARGQLDYASGATGMQLHVEEIVLKAEGRRVDVVTLRGGDGQRGRVEGSGVVELADGPSPAHYDLRLALSEMYVARLDEVDLRGNGELKLLGPSDSLTLAGVFRAEEATLRIPDRLPPDIEVLPVEHVNLRDSRRPASTAEEAAGSSPVALDLEIAFPSRLRVEDPNLDSEWRGTLFVRGDSAHPDIQGRLEVLRGRFDLAGIRFKATEGKLTFEEATNIPEIDVTAVAERNDIEATLRLQGPANAPTIDLSSDPALPQDEILSRLMFGETAGTLTAGQSIQLAQAAARLSGRGPGIGSAVLSRLRRIAGVDRIEIKDSGDPEESSTSVSVGKYIGSRVYVSYDQSVHGESSKARVEVEMTKHLSAETEVGQNETASVGLRWRWKY